MPAQMVVHEAGDEVIAVVVTGLSAQRQRDARFGASLLEQFGAQLRREELVGVADIHQQVRDLCAVVDQRHGVVLAPGLVILAEVAAQGLDAPGHQ